MLGWTGGFETTLRMYSLQYGNSLTKKLKFCHPRRSRYAFSFFGLVDLIAILPTWLAFIFPGWETLIVLRTLRIVRVFSLKRFSRAAMTIYNALQASRYKIGVFIIGLVLISVVAGSLMYIIESLDLLRYTSKRWDWVERCFTGLRPQATKILPDGATARILHPAASLRAVGIVGPCHVSLGASATPYSGRAPRLKSKFGNRQ